MAEESTSKVFSGNNWNLAPLRSLDDFILGSARFQYPQLNDLEKWGNRVVRNLLYYQTNYFMVYLIVTLVMITLNPIKLICGLLVQAAGILIIRDLFFDASDNFIVSKLLTDKRNAVGVRSWKWYIVGVASLLCGVFLYIFNALILSMFAVLLPVSIIFVHASLRLRNIKNKVVNTIEGFARSTPMANILDALKITTDND